MKRIITAFFLCLGALGSMAQQGGRIRITLVGAQCNKETQDDVLQLDGKKDELFFNFNFVLADRTGNPKLVYQKRTKVYGDNNGVFSNRIKAGSARDLFGNNLGGVQGGDIFYCNELMGEYDMAGDDVLSITPTIWEWDGGSDILAAFTNTMNTLTRPISTKAVQLAGGIAPAAGNVANIIFNADQLLLPSFTDVFATVFGKAGDRPIGMAPNGSFGPKQVVLKPTYIQTVVNSNLGYGLGVLSVNYDEEALGNTRDHGNYTILVKLEYMPAPGAPSPPAPAPPPHSAAGVPPPPPRNTASVPPPPPPANNGGVYAPPPPPIRRLSSVGTLATNVPFSIAGTWAGTYVNGNVSTPNYYYSFRLNADGSMQLLDANGNVTANGSYKFVNNQLTATYTYTNAASGSYSVVAAPDANGALTGTWGSGNNVSGGGKWTMTKK
jgi:hypothetical protein